MMSSDPRRPVARLAQSWWMETIHEGVAEVAAEKGWRLDARMRWHRGDPIPAPERADGVIVFTGHSTTLPEVVKALGAPIVDIETYADHYGAPKVVTYDTVIGEAAAHHLAADSPRALVLVNFIKGPSPIMDGRRKGFFDGAARMGIPAYEVPQTRFDPRELALTGPVGVFTGGDGWAAELVTRCIDAGVRVPDDIRIVGADDDTLICRSAPVALSSVNMGFKNKGRVAALLLDELMRGGTPPAKPVRVPIAGVTCRDSTRIATTGHPDLDRLVRHFRENAWRPVGVDVLCDECGVPSRTALHLLRKYTGSSPLALLSESRLRLADRFAVSGKLTREAIATAAGFPGAAALLRAERARGDV